MNTAEAVAEAIGRAIMKARFFGADTATGPAPESDTIGPVATTEAAVGIYSRSDPTP